MRRPGYWLLAAVLTLGAEKATPERPAPATPPVDEFFIVSSVDAGAGSLVLKRPTEVTLTIRVNAKTRCSSESGRPIQVSDLRAGDTIFLVSEREPSGQLVAKSIRLGVMTLPELQKRYLRAPLY